MSNYIEWLTIKLPISLADIASAVGRSFDPDVGGEQSFVPSDDGLTISVTTPCTAEFKAQADYLLANPSAMHEAILADYAARWAELPPPSLNEVQSFCGGIISEQKTAAQQRHTPERQHEPRIT